MVEFLTTTEAIKTHINGLSPNPSPVAFIEKKVYEKLLEFEASVPPEWSVEQSDNTKVYYPTAHDLEYGGVAFTISLARADAFANTHQMLSVVGDSWNGNQTLFANAKNLAEIHLPTIFLSCSPYNLGYISQLIGCTEEQLQLALKTTKYWKASEHIKWVNPYDPGHDLLMWLASQGKNFTEALTNHEKHEGVHPFIDYISNQAGFGVSNWLTEGFGEWVVGPSKRVQKHPDTLMKKFDKIPTWQELLNLMSSTNADPQLAKYSAGFVIVTAASYAFSNFTDFDSHMGAFLSSLVSIGLETHLDSIQSLEKVCEQKGFSQNDLDKAIKTVFEKFA